MEPPIPTARRSKKAVNVSISADLLQAARNGDINLSATLEAAIEHELRLLRKRERLYQNRNPASRKRFPLRLDIQSDLLEMHWPHAV